jgi:hypothetical protein
MFRSKRAEDRRQELGTDSAKVSVDYFQALHVPAGAAPETSEKSLRELSLKQNKPGLKAGYLSAMDMKVSGLNNWVQQLRDEVNYLKVRTVRHKKTIDSNMTRTLRLTYLEVFTLIVVAGVQVLTVRRFFDVQTRAHERQRGAMGGAGPGYRNAFNDINRAAGPFAGMAVDAAQRGVAGLMKTLGRGKAPKSYHLG